MVAHDHGFESLSGFGDALRRAFGDTPGRSKATRQILVTRLSTPLGPMMAGATDAGLCLLEFADNERLEKQLRRLGQSLDARFSPGASPVLQQIERELDEYFDGRLREFAVPLDFSGTEFQRAVWRALTKIPYGETRSYGEQARSIGRPDSVRAVGSANGRNPIAIVAPCHRVVGSNGKLTGYGGGLWRKRALLDHERGSSEPGLFNRESL